MKNYYRILNVGQDATAEDIKRSYRTLAKRYHPDVNKGDRAATRRFDDIHEAYMILSDADARAAYDEKLTKATTTRITANDLNDIDSIIARRTRENEAQVEQIRFRAQVQAQAQAQVQAQIKQLRDQIYKQGYEQGKKAGYASAEKDIMRINDDMKKLLADNEKFKKQNATYAGDWSELEQELFDRDRELARKNERIEELETQLSWMRTASGGNDALFRQLDLTRGRAQELRENAVGGESDSDPQVSPSPAAMLASLSPEQQDKRNRMCEQIDALNKQLDALATELERLNEESEQKLELGETRHFLTSMENRAEAWAQKSAADRRLAKSTLYGTLGVLIWATDEEVTDEYQKLKALYGGQKDADSVARLQKIQSAYDILSNPQKRKRYNESIGCPQERIETERRLIRENEAAQQQYRSRLAGKEFWGYFDELSSLALAGDAESQNALGELYYKGQSVERDFTQAVYWFREAFEQKHPAAIYNLGTCYLNGEGIGKNKNIGLGLIRQATNLGYTPPESKE